MKLNLENRCFEQQCADPTKLAVVGSDRELNWSEFKNAVESRVQLFKELQIPKGHPIIIFGHKEADFIVTIAAAIISQLPYVPVDSSTPKTRVQLIAKTIQSNILIDCVNQNSEWDLPLVICANDRIQKCSLPKFSLLPSWNEQDPIVYVIFTSGSTGGPKGVQISQSSLLSFAKWLESDFDFKNSDVFMNQAPFSFDLSVYELVGTLHFGGTLVLCSAHSQLLEKVKTNQCTVWVSTPSFASMQILHTDFNSDHLPSLQTFVFCGETLPPTLVRQLLDRFPNSRVLNTYGPTEATVATTLVNITKEILDKYPVLPVGFPKPKSKITISPIAASNYKGSGEIVILGEHVSVGYFGTDEKTSELNQKKFILENDMRGFCTGDLGYLKDGMLFFLGRMDFQVKLHGFRIELGEIDDQILKSEEVLEVATIPLERDGKVKKLISFVSLIDGKKINEIEIRQKLFQRMKESLPYYMIPAEIRFLSQLPHNTNHKINRADLIRLALS